METLLSILGPLHPPTVHFPIACSVLAVLFFILGKSLDRPWLSQSAAALWITAFVTSLPAAWTGQAFARHLGMMEGLNPIPPEAAMKGMLRAHVLLALAGEAASLAALVGAVKLLRGRPWPFPVQLSLGLAAALFFGLTGHEGGKMVYGTASGQGPAGQGSGEDILSQAAGYRKNLVKMNSKPWMSKTHGRRWVNTYVSKEAVQAYEAQEDLPEGALVVKDSFQDEAMKSEGPLYVMLKGKASDSPATGGWKYGLKWDRPVAGNPEKILGPVKWLPGDANLDSCVKCHQGFKALDYMGGIPEGFERQF